MKRKLAVVLSMICAVSLLAGCGSKDAAENNTTNDAADTNTVAESTEETAAPVAEGAVKTGLGIITTVSGESATADAEGNGEADAVVVAVTVDANGVITNCVIDIAQTNMTFDATGVVTADTAAEYPSKQELGADYGMIVASGIGKEWFEQADAFAAYCVGKTADEVAGIAVDEAGHTTDTDLAASCTMGIVTLQDAVKKAVDNSVEGGAQAGDKLGIGLYTTIDKSADATADAEGVVQAYTNVAAVTVDASGVITSATIDAVQANVNFDTTGTITTDLTAEVASKNELGDAYGMKVASSIGKEWNEQAAAYAQYAVGKTAADVTGTELDEQGLVADVDLAASVTIHVGPFNTVIEKAVNNAK